MHMIFSISLETLLNYFYVKKDAIYIYIIFVLRHSYFLIINIYLFFNIIWFLKHGFTVYPSLTRTQSVVQPGLKLTKICLPLTLPPELGRRYATMTWLFYFIELCF